MVCNNFIDLLKSQVRFLFSRAFAQECQVIYEQDPKFIKCKY